jgi:prevent-host-death family protein
MQYVSATEAKQELAKILDTAQREPVMIQKQKRDIAVMLSVQEYEKLTAINLDDFEKFCVVVGQKAQEKGLSEKGLSAILKDGDD